MEDMALVQKRRKKEREAWWKKILAYYMMQKMADEQAKARLLQAYAFNHILITTEEIVIKEGMLSRLFRKEPGRLSAMEILERMAQGEKKDSPFRSLLNKIRQEPMSEEETEKAIAEVIEKAPPMTSAWPMFRASSRSFTDISETSSFNPIREAISFISSTSIPVSSSSAL